MAGNGIKSAAYPADKTRMSYRIYFQLMGTKTIKQTVLPAAIISILLSYSCSKNNSTNSNATNNQKTILGEWKWIKSTGGWGDTKMSNSDTIVTLKLNTDSTYFVLLNNQVKYAGSFSGSLSSILDSLLVLEFDQNIEAHQLRIPKMQSIVYFNNDTCILYDYRIADGYSHLYYRR